jgi:hypothetical protein
VLAVALAGVIAGSAVAQVPNVQVYFNLAHTETQAFCPGGPPGTVVTTLYVVMNNWNMNITAVDFSIQYPASLAWVGETLPQTETMIAVGSSPVGVAIAYANCCAPDGFQAVEVLRVNALWGPCDCGQGPQALVVGGYTPLGKTQPTAVRKEDFQEFAGVGMTSLVCPIGVATEATTWGQVKALYR